jgi:hypothetical protein
MQQGEVIALAAESTVDRCRVNVVTPQKVVQLASVRGDVNTFVLPFGPAWMVVVLFRRDKHACETRVKLNGGYIFEFVHLTTSIR